MATAKKFTVEVTVPTGAKEGDTFTVEVEAPELPKQARGKLAGIALEDMTDEQLKVELINSKSVLYKATQRGAAKEVIDRSQARVDAAKAEKEKRTPVVPVAPVKMLDGDADVKETASDDTIDEEAASEM